MQTRYVFAGAVLAGALALGCEQKPEAQPSPRRTTTSDTSTPTVDRSNAQGRAQTLIDQCTEHIRNSEFDAADANLRELESMKSDLSQNLQNQISQLRSRLDSVKASNVSPSGTRSPSTINPPSTTNPPLNPPNTPPTPSNPPSEPPNSL